MKKRMHKTLESTKFKGCPICAVAAKPGGSEVQMYNRTSYESMIGLFSISSESTYIIKLYLQQLYFVTDLPEIKWFGETNFL